MVNCYVKVWFENLPAGYREVFVLDYDRLTGRKRNLENNNAWPGDRITPPLQKLKLILPILIIKRMRKLKLQMQLSIDGFAAAGPNDEQKWVTWAWGEIKQYVLDLNDTADTEIIGRKLAVDYIPYWLDTFTKPEDPMYEVAKRFVNKKKIVFTKTLERSEWENTELAKGNLTDEVDKLKSQNGKDIIVYGGCSFVSALIKNGLIDEYHFFINPVALGTGWRIFDELKNWQKLKLKKCIAYDSGIVLLHYEKK